MQYLNYFEYKIILINFDMYIDFSISMLVPTIYTK